jgi:hypothetical protein
MAKSWCPPSKLRRRQATGCATVERDAVPTGTVLTAQLTLSLRQDGVMLAVDCATALETESKTFLSSDTTRWGPYD